MSAEPTQPEVVHVWRFMTDAEHHSSGKYQVVTVCGAKEAVWREPMLYRPTSQAVTCEACKAHLVERALLRGTNMACPYP